MEGPGGDREARRQLEELAAQVEVNRADIDALQRGAEAAGKRAEAAELAAETQQRLIDELVARGLVDREAIDDLMTRNKLDRKTMTELADRVRVDREMIAELQTEGVVREEQVAGLELALRASRTIGAALGIIVATREVDEKAAFELLKVASQRTNRKVRALAEYILLTGDLRDLPRTADGGAGRS